MVEQPDISKEISVRHTMHFYVDGEAIDFQIHYELPVSNDFPKKITIQRTNYTLKKSSFIVHSDLATHLGNLHLHAHYEAD
jgi:hypothetical protein